MTLIFWQKMLNSILLKVRKNEVDIFNTLTKNAERVVHCTPPAVRKRLMFLKVLVYTFEHFQISLVVIPLCHRSCIVWQISSVWQGSIKQCSTFYAQGYYKHYIFVRLKKKMKLFIQSNKVKNNARYFFTLKNFYITSQKFEIQIW